MHGSVSDGSIVPEDHGGGYGFVYRLQDYLNGPFVCFGRAV